MDVEFFCLNQHESLGETIRRLIATRLDTNVNMKVSNIDSAGKRLGLVGGHYARLLAASTLPEQGLSIEVKAYDWRGRVPYVNIYWWIYVCGYTFLIGKQYFEEGGFKHFFPAVAFRDRMILVPKGQNETLQELGRSSPQLPGPEVPGHPRDIIEVDFENAAELDDAVSTLALELRQEIDHEIHAYRTLHPATELEQIAQSLGFDIGFVSRLLREVAVGQADLYRNLGFNLSTNTIKFGEWNRLNLVITNKSESEIPRAVVICSGPAEIRPTRIEVNVRALCNTEVDLAIKAEEPGEFPLEFKLVPIGDDLLEQWLPIYNVWVKVEMNPNAT